MAKTLLDTYLLTHNPPQDGKEPNLAAVKTPFEVAAMPFQLSGSKKRGCFHLTNGTFRMFVDATAPGDWALVFYFSGDYWLQGYNAAMAKEWANCRSNSLRVCRTDGFVLIWPTSFSCAGVGSRTVR